MDNDGLREHATRHPLQFLDRQRHPMLINGDWVEGRDELWLDAYLESKSVFMAV